MFGEFQFKERIEKHNLFGFFYKTILQTIYNNSKYKIISLLFIGLKTISP